MYRMSGASSSASISGSSVVPGLPKIYSTPSLLSVSSRMFAPRRSFAHSRDAIGLNDIAIQSNATQITQNKFVALRRSFTRAFQKHDDLIESESLKYHVSVSEKT